MKLGLSVVVPVTGDLNSCSILQDYLQSSISDIDLNIIYLINRKIPQPESSVRVESGVEVVFLGSDRYFGSCEENIYRIQDVSSILKAYVYIIGEHDKIIWENMSEALGFQREVRAEVLAVNIMGSQLLANGAVDQLPALVGRNSKRDNLCNTVVNSLFSGAVLNGAVAFPSMLSVYGPNDWAAFIGAHIYTRESFVRVLSFRFSDQVYSLTHANLAFQVSTQPRYAFFNKCAALRISDEFSKISRGIAQSGWLEEHRRVMGLSKYFWVSHLSYINQIEEPQLFNLILNCRTLAQRSNKKGYIAYEDGFFIKDLLGWCYYILQFHQEKVSFYIKTLSVSPYYYEMRVILEFLERFASWVELNLKNEGLANNLLLAQGSISLFLNNCTVDISLIANAAANIWEAIMLLDSALVEEIHELSVREFHLKEAGFS